MQIALIKTADNYLGRYLSIVLGSQAHRHIGDISSILIIRPGGIGDAVLLAHSINSIKKSYPNSHITILAERRNCEVFSFVPQADKILCYDRPKEFAEALLGKFDVVIDTEQWYRLSAIVARFVRAPVKIGFNTNERRRMFNHPIPYFQDEYEAISFSSLLTPLGIDQELRKKGESFLIIPASASEKAVCLTEPLGDMPFVVIFPGASISEKRWITAEFGLVAKQLVEGGYQVVVVGSYKDRAESDLICRAGGLNLAGLTTLTETAAVIARSRLVISGDSGVLHIAVGLGIPTVSLFGPSNVAKWAPKGEKHVVLHSKLECSPCSKFGTIPPCPNDARCMKEITADQVLEAAVSLLQKFG
ncbi:MAG TPA: glycosyltransferase family 9 protein [Deltaproteobacteria bacterium]|nr:glycosyltransferase family 9 protein [Deltaproteobacteria bacterium]HQB39183.1 glycosyltransferase family 9 protein [Deltaproteobacteria bacterium]